MTAPGRRQALFAVVTVAMVLAVLALGSRSHPTRVELARAPGPAGDEVAARRRPDSIIYVNVLEHVPDDEGELRAVHRALAPGGRVFIFVPAFRWLYGGFDRRVAHVRRYTRPELEGKCAAAGFHVLKSVYFDLAGVAPWWIKYRLLKSDSMEPGLVKLYDRCFVPLVKVAERVVPPPLGKNVLLVAEKG